MSSCPAVCYEEASRYVGCAANDYQCHCKQEPEGSFHLLFDGCVDDCGGDSTVKPNMEFLSKGISHQPLDAPYFTPRY